MKFLS